MSYSRFALAAAFAAMVAPAASYAASATYDFTSDDTVCGVNQTGVGQPGICAAPGDPYDLTSTRSDPTAPTLSATGSGTEGGGTEEGINHFDIGLGVGDRLDNAGGRIGQLEDLVLTFGQQVKILSFTVATRPGRAFLEQQGELVNGLSELFDHGGGSEETVVDVSGKNIVGSVFTWTNITPSVEPSDAAGYFLASVTIDDTPIIPVPPALPLLGGALGLLVWRARRAKKAAA